MRVFYWVLLRVMRFGLVSMMDFESFLLFFLDGVCFLWFFVLVGFWDRVVMLVIMLFGLVMMLYFLVIVWVVKVKFLVIINMWMLVVWRILIIFGILGWGGLIIVIRFMSVSLDLVCFKVFVLKVVEEKGDDLKEYLESVLWVRSNIWCFCVD